MQFDQAMFESRPDRMVREKVEQIVNRMLDAEADEIASASRYERTGGRKAYRAGHYGRRVTAKAGGQPKCAYFRALPGRNALKQQKSPALSQVVLGIEKPTVS